MASNQNFEDDDLEGPFDESAFAHSSGSDDLSDDLTTDDLEEAYLKALDAMESAEWAVPETDDAIEAEIDVAPPGNSDRLSSDRVSPDHAPAAEPAANAPTGVEIAGSNFLGGNAPESQPVARELVYDTDAEPPAATAPAKPAAVSQAEARDPGVKPLRVIEACLFVGGQPLSAKKLASLLDGNNDASDIEKLIDDLNLEYAAQARPYEIRLGDGGYKLTLRAEYEVIRSRVYGVGPRDVKLSQDVLEVLALVAYQQPIAQSAVEACKPNSANILRQLLRRELISLTRIDQSRHGVEYTTTPRFLQLFGLAHLNELPRPEDLSIR